MRLVGVVGAAVGNDPFGARTWSGSGRRFFTELRAQEMLERAFGAQLPRLQRYALMAQNFYPERRTWSRRFALDPRYGEALTQVAGAQLRPSDFAHGILQIGAYFNLPRYLDGRAPCFSFHDGNLVESVRAGQAPPGVPRRRIDAALAWEREVSRGMKQIFTFSNYLRRSFIKEYGIPEDRVAVVGGGINLDSIPDHVPDKRYDTEEVLFVGIEFERKGGPELLRAFRAVSLRRPRARLHIVGPRKLDIPDHLSRGVVFHGFLDRGQPDQRARFADLMRRASVFVLPSRYEPFGIAPLEAMVHQIPCIVTDDWAMCEFVRPDQNGLLVRRGDADDIADKLNACLGEPDTLRRWADAGRKMVIEQFTWQHVVRRLRAALEPTAPRETVGSPAAA